ncbi:splicing factor 3A subunit [Nesidiocoris tenuis]|uniref:Splicing factor 3A subunit n=1 Tax=Nesidiocoris tenuis TaxID=355587 RepID=A0ABN7AWK2_9HEMI|nr:splicing factor 3A subunit [Nesidiocoris tenuis]
MPSIEVAQPPPKEESTAPAGKPLVGIIYPPPEVRNIVDKTASFVARNGPEFESRIRQNELGNPKFNFLNGGDPYHAYYQHKVKDFKEGKGVEPAAPAAAPTVQKVSTATQLKQQEILKQVAEPFVPKDPPPDFEFMADPPSISALDLDIVKLTAQFAARNGRQFLTNLLNREQRNYQFDFLRPQHSLFQYFTKLLEQYTKVLIPPKDMMAKLKEECNSAAGVLEQVRYRADWLRYQEVQKRKEEQAIEKERVAYAQIDWHDFVVVETVDYQPGEIGNFPPPTTPDEVGARVLMQERVQDSHVDDGRSMQVDSDDDLDKDDSDEEEQQPQGEKGAADNTQVQDMEEESSSGSEDEDDRRAPPPPQHKTINPGDPKKAMQPPLPPAPDKVIVKKDYNPKQTAKITKAGENYLISPLTSEKIPASKVQEHMRIGLLDPRWVEQRDKHIQDKMNQDTVYAGGSAIEASLKQLAERRTDIFGIGDEETAIGKKIGEEDKKKDDKVTWDGHTSSVEAATRAARANITIEEQIHQIHKVQGLLPDEEKEKIGPKPVPSNRSHMQPPTPAAPPPLPPPKMQPQPPLPPPPQVAAPMPPPGMMAAPRPPIMMVPAPIQPPLMVPPGAFPVVAATPQAFMAPPGTAPLPPAPQPAQVSNILKQVASAGEMNEDEPVAKKMKTEENLIPEAQFLANNRGPAAFKVHVPLMADKPEWKLNGQTLTFTMPLTESVAALKVKIQETVGMPPAKQKLQCDGIFYKDSNSLAYYNVGAATIVQLQLKERGGRKK